MKESHKFFQNRKCKYFPCHVVDNKRDFNCLFCYCPLYSLGDNCGGNFKYLKNGVKDCSDCNIPHSKNGYEYQVKLEHNGYTETVPVWDIGPWNIHDNYWDEEGDRLIYQYTLV